MGTISKKLHSKTGASIIIALLGFLVATMVSVVVVTAALSSAKRVHDDITDTQNRLTLESAAQMIAAKMEDSTCTKTVWDYNETVASATETDHTDYASSGTFGTLLDTAIESIDNVTGKVKSGKFNISVDGFDGVSAYYSMMNTASDGLNENGVLFYVYFTPSGNSNSESESDMKICIKMQCSESTDYYTQMTYVTYKDVDENGEEVEKSYEALLYTKTTFTYSWYLDSIQIIDSSTVIPDS